jgi:hypothetical protein
VWNPDAPLGSRAGIVIERSDAKNEARLSRPLGNQM